jgi:hypothetical protein
VAVEAEVALGGRKADQDRAVDVGGKRCRLEDADDVEPLVAEPDPLAWVDAADAEPRCGRRAENGDRQAGARGVEVATLGDGRSDGGG